MIHCATTFCWGTPLRAALFVTFSVLATATQAETTLVPEKREICAVEDDVCKFRFLDRVAWGASSRDWESVKSRSLNAYLQEQLGLPHGARRIPKGNPSAKAIDPAARLAVDLARVHYSETRRIRAIKDVDQQQMENRANRRKADQAAEQTTHQFIEQSVVSDLQIRERMTWFWVNHFSIDVAKGNAGFLLPGYLELIRSHALGNFRDMLREVVKSPSMLVYLDNTRNSKGRINENLARELLELHTLGANGGYSQADVTGVARILTGLGVTFETTAPKLPAATQKLYIQKDLFKFDPRLHDETEVKVLGQRFSGDSVDVVDRLVDMLAEHPSTARSIARKLLIYFVEDVPAESDVMDIAQVFLESDGDITQTLVAIFDLPSFRKSLGTPRFKSPIAYVFSAARLAKGDEITTEDVVKLARDLTRLGSRPFRRITPDGYPLQSSKWIGSGQLLYRLDVARRIARSDPSREHKRRVEGRPICLNDESGFGDILLKTLRTETKKAIGEATAYESCNVLLYSSPDFMSN